MNAEHIAAVFAQWAELEAEVEYALERRVREGRLPKSRMRTSEAEFSDIHQESGMPAVTFRDRDGDELVVDLDVLLNADEAAWKVYVAKLDVISDEAEERKKAVYAAEHEKRERETLRFLLSKYQGKP